MMFGGVKETGKWSVAFVTLVKSFKTGTLEQLQLITQSCMQKPQLRRNDKHLLHTVHVKTLWSGNLEEYREKKQACFPSKHTVKPMFADPF